MAALSTRVWNDTPIPRRTSDGFFNATAMCKANGKEWKHYFETNRASLYLEALSSSVGIPTHELFQSKGGNGGGTWVHPQVAIDLARWISSPFAVWMDSWFLNQFEQQSQPQQARAELPKRDLLETVRESIDLLNMLGGVDDRAELMLKDMVLNYVARQDEGKLTVAQVQAVQLFSLSDCLVKAGATPYEATKLAPKLGKQVKAWYSKERGHTPPTHDQLVNGKAVPVCDYDVEFFDNISDFLSEVVSDYRESKAM